MSRIAIAPANRQQVSKRALHCCAGIFNAERAGHEPTLPITSFSVNTPDRPLSAKILHKAEFRQSLEQAPDAEAMLKTIKDQGKK